MDEIITNGKVIRGWLGVYIQNITPELAKALNLNSTKGVLVSKVQKDSPAEKAGLKEEDVILTFNGKSLNNASELSTWVASSSPGQDITLQVLRDGKEMNIKVNLGELNEAQQAMAQGKSQYSDIGIQVANIVPELITHYHLDKDVKGVVITSVNPSGVAASVGLQEGDVIMKMNRHTITSVADFNKEISNLKSGDNLLLYIRRGSANLFVAFTIPEK